MLPNGRRDTFDSKNKKRQQDTGDRLQRPPPPPLPPKIPPSHMNKASLKNALAASPATDAAKHLLQLRRGGDVHQGGGNDPTNNATSTHDFGHDPMSTNLIVEGQFDDADEPELDAFALLPQHHSNAVDEPVLEGQFEDAPEVNADIPPTRHSLLPPVTITRLPASQATTTTTGRRPTSRKQSRRLPLTVATLPVVAASVAAATNKGQNQSEASSAASRGKDQQLAENAAIVASRSTSKGTRTTAYGTKLGQRKAAASPTERPYYERTGPIPKHPSNVLVPTSNIDASRRLAVVSPVASDVETKLRPIAPNQLRADADILLGRGNVGNLHPGNIWFRDLVAAYRPAYAQAAKFNKSQLARNLLNYIRHCNGRFLARPKAESSKDSSKKTTNSNSTEAEQRSEEESSLSQDGGGEDDGETTCWYECGDARAMAKLSQSLREGTSSGGGRKRSRSEAQPGGASSDKTQEKGASKGRKRARST